jgi:glycine cleavage system H protein
MQFPSDLQYTKQHAWVRVVGAEAVAGITDHAQKELGDIVFIESPKVGTALTQGKPYGVVESVKSVSDLIAPVSGSVARVNGELANAPELVNQDPYGNGWIVAISLADPAQLPVLLTAEQYESWLAEIGK